MAEFSSLNGYTVKDTTARNIAKGRNQAVAYSNYGAMVDALNAMDNAEFRTGQNIYIGTVGVPDLWVYTVEPVRNTFSYVSDEKTVELLQNNTTIQVGYYKLAMLEGQKVDLTNVNAAIAENASAISEQNKNMIRYNPETDCFDVYVNGVLIGSKIVGFTTPAALVPRLTSDNLNVLRSAEIGVLGSGAYYAWEAFNGTASNVHDCWADNKSAKGKAYLGYNFDVYKTVTKFYLKNVVMDSNGPYAPKSFVLQGSNNLTEWYDIQSYSGHGTTLGYEKEYYVDNPTMYKAFRLLFTDWMTTSSNQTVAVCQLQFYGY